MTPEAQDQELQAQIARRVDQLTQWVPALQQAWPALAPLLEERRARYVTRLIATEDEQARGRIKELSDLLELPMRLQRELAELHQKAQAGEVLG